MDLLVLLHYLSALHLPLCHGQTRLDVVPAYVAHWIQGLVAVASLVFVAGFLVSTKSLVGLQLGRVVLELVHHLHAVVLWVVVTRIGYHLPEHSAVTGIVVAVLAPVVGLRSVVVVSVVALNWLAAAVLDAQEAASTPPSVL
jgi:hypothetical protein